LRVSVRQLSKAYGFRWALKDSSFELVPGEYVALLGPNGAGKTTLLKLLAGLIHPTTGYLELDGEKLARSSTALRAMIGFLSPDDHLYENLTVSENLRFFTSLYEKSPDDVEMKRVLSRVGLQQRCEEYVFSLSTGMKCRLSIAKWLLVGPGLLLLDEPYAVLDGSGVGLLENFLKAHCHQGGVVVMATHHVSRVVQFCTRAIILNQGKLIFNERRQEPWDDFHRAFGELLPDAET
jgi:heme ABC exporter ATP-binding subunit CcmA